MSRNNYSFIDLFAGAGGLSEGFYNNEFEPIAHVEMNNYAAETLKTRACYLYLKLNNNLETYYKYLKSEITKEQLYNAVPKEVLQTVINSEISEKTYRNIFAQIDAIMVDRGIQHVDVIIGGPPCQAYSLVGRASDKDSMKNDPRNELYIQYAKFLIKYQPKIFVFENVPGMINAKDGLIWKRIKQRLKTVGYNINHREIYANDFGVLQKRKRIIIIGWKKEFDLAYPLFNNINFNATVNDILSDLPALNPGDTNNNYISPPNDYLIASGIRNHDDILTDHQTRKIRDVDREIYRIAIRNWNNNHGRLKYDELPERLQFHKNVKSFLDRFKVVEGDMPYCHTMLAHISKDGHYYIHPDINQCRSLSVREAARIQSFPDSFYFEGPRTAKFTQIGNAVPPLMATEIARAVKEMLLEVE